MSPKPLLGGPTRVDYAGAACKMRGKHERNHKFVVALPRARAFDRRRQFGRGTTLNRQRNHRGTTPGPPRNPSGTPLGQTRSEHVEPQVCNSTYTQSLRASQNANFVDRNIGTTWWKR